MNDTVRALLVSPTDRAREAAAELEAAYDWVPLDRAEQAVVLGGDGFMLQTLHRLLDRRRVVPAFGLNLGTVGFLMNEWRQDNLLARIDRATSVRVDPLAVTVNQVDGAQHSLSAINELSLLRETRQTAKLEVAVNGHVVLPELVCDGIIVATPAGSTAYNLSANGPILPLGSGLIALTPISPFRPRRWRGAILRDSTEIVIRVLEASKRPVSAVADQKEVRDIAAVRVTVDRARSMSLLFDPEQTLEERIISEQFAV